MKRSRAKKSRGKGKPTKSVRRKELDFGFFIFVCLILAGIGVYILVQHQGAVNSEFKQQKVEKQISSEGAKQATLRIKLASLRSPSRISRIAQDELGMTEPGGVIYLRYKRESNGKIVCRSSYEKRSQEAKRQKTGGETGSPGEKQNRSITKN